jgi:hypothetical protein
VVPTLALAAAVAGEAVAANAEPLLLTSSQMEAVTAGQVINISPEIAVNAGNVAILQQLNVTNQIAVALAIATAANAHAVATAANANLTVQSILR